ncbi:MAG: nucleoside phosphorylase [Catalinimonas sp.]
MISPADLILHPDGSAYHLGLRPDEVPDLIFTVGDPDRVGRVSRHFDAITFERQRREFRAHGGRLAGRDVLAISSGMGTGNVEILLTELDALVNVDPVRREPVDRPRVLQIVRLGTSGALQPDLPLDTHLASHTAVGLDTLTAFYDVAPSPEEAALSAALRQHLDLPFAPYVAGGDPALRTWLAPDLVGGLTLTCPGFYAPQGRRVRLRPRPVDLLSRYRDFRLGDRRLDNFEMETAAYYALGRLLGHAVLSLNALVANRYHERFSSNATAAVDALIHNTLARV